MTREIVGGEDLLKKLKLRPIKEIMKYFEMMDPIGLRELSNQLIEDAIGTEDPVIVDLSLISYALSKLVIKPHFVNNPKWKTFQKNLITHLAEIDGQSPSHILDIVLKDIKNFDDEAGNYTDDIIEKARVKQASRAYAFGISLGKAAELTGTDKSLLLNYIGFTKIHERPFTQSKPILERYKYLKELLGD